MESDPARINEVLVRLGGAWHAKETVRGIYRILDYETGAAAVRRLAEDLQYLGLPSEVNRLGRTFERWQAQIPDWHAARVTNAPTEAVNNRC